VISCLGSCVICFHQQQLQETLSQVDGYYFDSHKAKSKALITKRETAHEDRLQRLLAAMDKKCAQYNSEIQHRHTQRSLRDIGKVQTWWKIIKVLNAAAIAKKKIDLIRLERRLNGPKFDAVIKLQRWCRAVLAFRRRALASQFRDHGHGTDNNLQDDARVSRRRSTKVTWKSGFENLKNLLADTNTKDLLTERINACTVLISFIRSVSRCFRGHVHKYLM
jgi:hypothetical protein